MAKLPRLKSEKEIHEFWKSRSATDFKEDLHPVKARYVGRPRKRLVSVRIDEETLNSIQKFAEEKGLGYATVMRMWLKEKVREHLPRYGR